MESILNTLIRPNSVIIFSKTWCPYCDEAKDSLTKLQVKYNVYELDKTPLSDSDVKRLNNLCGFKTVPKIFIGKTCIGGNSDLQSLISSGEIKQVLDEESIKYKI